MAVCSTKKEGNIRIGNKKRTKQTNRKEMTMQNSMLLIPLIEKVIFVNTVS